LETLAYQKSGSKLFDTEVINFGDDTERGTMKDAYEVNPQHPHKPKPGTSAHSESEDSHVHQKMEHLRNGLHRGELNTSNTASEDIRKMVEDPFQNVLPKDIKKELRARIYKLLKHNIQVTMDKNQCRPDIVRCLKLLCDMCSDQIED
jgi:hypothetical protein